MSNVERIHKAYTDEQAARLAHISLGQIRYWDRTNFFEPSISFEDRRVAVSRIYTFDDVIALRVLGELRNNFDVPLQHLRRVRDRFDLPQEAWANEELYVLNKRVYFKNERGRLFNSETGEEALPDIPLPRVITDVKSEASALAIRPREIFGTKSRSSRIAKSAEVFSGTRIPIDVVKEYFDEGLSIDDILEDYPTLSREDIDAAVRWFGIRAA